MARLFVAWPATDKAPSRLAGARYTLPILLRCDHAVTARAKYVFDTLFMAADLPVTYVTQPPEEGPWLLYAPSSTHVPNRERCVWIVHSERAWRVFDGPHSLTTATVEGLVCPVPDSCAASNEFDIGFDLVANALYFLSCWSERGTSGAAPTRGLFKHSVFSRNAVPQDIVDRYLERVLQLLSDASERLASELRTRRRRSEFEYGVVLSHDVDYVSSSKADVLWQGIKTIGRHLVGQRDLADATRALYGLAKALIRGRDPYGCIPEIIARESELGVRASFQIAVGRRHPADVAYRIEDDSTRDYLAAILRAGFDLCLHGSVRSTERVEWYVEEAALLEKRLAKPRGSRQHFLSFVYENLFRAQEQAGIQYDMSIGYPDRIGPRSGFSYPFFPYSLAENRPYDVVEISLFLMDVTLRSYMGLKGKAAWDAVEAQLSALRRKRGCASIVWHPIVFGGARDPGDADLFWRIVDHVVATGGLATDGRSMNDLWRMRAMEYESFAGISRPLA